MLTISFSYQAKLPKVKNITHFKSFIPQIFLHEKKPLHHLTYVFCTDAFILEINKAFLNHDYYTDVITFDLSEGKNIIGEVYISLDRVKENAFLLKNKFANELHRVIIHAALHLCGYKDKTKSEILAIRNKEEEYLRLLATMLIH